MTTGRQILGGAGTATAALAFGGSPSPGATELWNGTNWTEVNDLNVGRTNLNGNGTSTSALAIGGQNPASTITESWNGTNWINVQTMSVAKRQFGAAGTSNTVSIAFGGDLPGNSAATEEWYGDGKLTETFTTS